MVVAIACIFAISAFAAPYDKGRTELEYTDASGVTHTVPVVRESVTAQEVASKLGNNSDQQALFVDDDALAVIADSNGNLFAVPTWYLIEPSGHDKTYVAISELEYTYVNGLIEGSSFSRGATRYIEFPRGMTHMRNNGVFGRGTHYENKITEIAIPNTVHTIQSQAFSKNATLKSVYIPTDNIIQTINDDAFIECYALESFDFTRLKSITLIDGFNSCRSLTGVLDLTASTALTEIGSNCFNGCNFTEARLPDSVKYLRQGVFKNNGLTAINLPASLEYIGDDALSGNPNMVLSSGILPQNLSYVGINFLSGCQNLPSLIVFPQGVTSIPDEGFPNVKTPNGQGTLTIVFLGKMTNLIIDGSTYADWAEHVTVYLAQNTISDFNGKVYSYTDKEAGTLGTSVSQSGTLKIDVSDRSPSSTSKVGDNFIEIIFCGASGEVEQSYVLTTNGDSITEDRGAYDFAGHTHQVYYADTTDCTKARYCFICDANLACQNHEMGYEIEFSDVTSFGVKYERCTNEGCTVSASEQIAPVIEMLGYSAKQNGNSICLGYKINQESLELYETATGNTVSFGVATIIPINEAELNPVFVENGEIKGIPYSVVQTVPSSYAGFDFRLNGFTSDDYGTELVMCAFAVENGNVSYLCVGENGFGAYATASTVTFNSKATQDGEFKK